MTSKIGILTKKNISSNRKRVDSLKRKQEGRDELNEICGTLPNKAVEVTYTRISVQ